MDEILASIRKIISDDEPEQGAQPDTAADSAPASGNPADDMSGAIAQAPAGSEEADDILDLTQVVQPDPAVHETQPQAMSDGPPQGDALQAALTSATETPEPHQDANHAPSANSETPVSQGDVGSDIAALLAEAGVEDTVSDGASAAAVPSAEETSITEALKAIDDDETISSPASVEDASMTVGDEAPVAESISEPATPAFADVQDSSQAVDDLSAALEAADSPVTDPLSAAVAAVDAGEETVAAEADQPVIEMPKIEESAVVGDPVLAEPEVAEVPAEAAVDGIDMLPEIPELGSATSIADDLVAEAPAEITESEDAEPEITATNEAEIGEDTGAIAAESGDAAPASFEQGIKDMLKPMLKNWIDDNMERIVHDAVKEQVTSDSSAKE